MQQVLLQVTLHIDEVHVLSLKDPLPYWLKLQKNPNPETFEEYFGHPDWDEAMN